MRDLIPKIMSARLSQMPTLNGTASNGVAREKEAQRLGQAMSEGYRPTLPLWATFSNEAIPQFYLLRDIELMLIHPIVLNGITFYKGGITGAEFEIECDDSEVGDFIDKQLKRFWRHGLPMLQGAYDYGWIGCEAVYKEVDGILYWDHCIQFSPRDVFYLTQDHHPIGMRVKNVHLTEKMIFEQIATSAGGTGNLGQLDLWFATEDVPAKALWYSHNPRFSQYYGRSQLIGAWRPWRRLAWRDGVETVIDMALYRFGIQGPLIRYPEEDFQGQVGAVATTQDSEGNSRKYARDFARQTVEQAKAGASIGLPSGNYPSDMGGGEKWSLEWPEITMNADPLINAAKYLHDMIYSGIGVPPELLQAAQTGSGYSGRAIPWEGFLMLQQGNADRFLEVFNTQSLRPCVRWNWGDVRYTVRVKSLLESKQKMQQAGQEQPGMGEEVQPTPHTPGQVDQGTAPQPGAGGLNTSGNQLSMNAPLLTDRIRELAVKSLRRTA